MYTYTYIHIYMYDIYIHTFIFIFIYAYIYIYVYVYDPPNVHSCHFFTHFAKIHVHHSFILFSFEYVPPPSKPPISNHISALCCRALP